MGLALVAQGREELISAIEMGDAVEVLQVSISDIYIDQRILVLGP